MHAYPAGLRCMEKRLGEEILSGLSTLNIPASVITVEIIDTDRDSYGKYAPK